MEIYKRGQGTYARGLAIICFILFAGWLCWEIYRLPSDFAVVVKIDKILDLRTVRSAIEEDIKELKVKGLANQKIDMSILDQTASYFVESPSGERIVLAGEKYTAPRVKRLQSDGFKFAPVEGRDMVAVDDLIPGMELKRAVMVPSLLKADFVEPGKPLTEEQAQRLQRLNSEAGGVMIRDSYPDEESWKNKDQTKVLKSIQSPQVKAGMVLSEVPQYMKMEELAIQGSILTKELIEKIKAKRSQFPALAVEDAGRINIADQLETIEGRYLRAAEQKRIQTWITKPLFMLPLVRLEVAVILIVALVLFLGLSGAALYSWNLKRWNDLLIDTQIEMKKVSWPKRQELVSSSVIVIVMVLALGFYLYVVDLILSFLSRESGLYAGG